MRYIRTFVAVLIADDLKAEVAKVQDQVKKLAPDVKWVAPVNFHVTLKFLGNVREDELSAVYDAVESAVNAFPAFDFSLSGVGAFPSSDKARVVWVGIEDGCEQLKSIASAVEKALEKLGFEKEDRSFKAHITIGRAKKNPVRFSQNLSEVEAADLGRQRISSIAVMQSELQREGSEYTPLCVIKLIDNE